MMLSANPKVINNRSFIASFVMFVCGICCGPISAGYVIGYSSPAVANLKLNEFLTDSQLALFGSLMNIGGMLGCMIVGILMDKYGRRLTLFFSMLPALVGWLVIGYATNLPVEHFTHLLYTGRVLTGMSCGMSMAVTAVYLVEIAPTAWRGRIGSCNQLGIVIGILVAFTAGLSFDYEALALLGLVFPFLLLGTLFCAPESPRWLLQMDKPQEAIVALQKLRPMHYDSAGELREIQGGIQGDPDSFSYADFLRAALRRPFFVALGLMVFQQLSGINAVMFYAEPIFLSAGFASDSGYCAVILGVVQVVFTMIMVNLADRVGRTTLLKSAGIIMGVSLVVFATLYDSPKLYGLIPVVSLIVYMAGFSMGWGPIPMLLTAEIFPNRARSGAQGLAITVNWMTSFIVTQVFPIAQDSLGAPSIMYILAGFCTLGVLFVVRYVPETKGKTLEDIETFFSGPGQQARAPAKRTPEWSV